MMKRKLGLYGSFVGFGSGLGRENPGYNQAISYRLSSLPLKKISVLYSAYLGSAYIAGAELYSRLIGSVLGPSNFPIAAWA